VTLPDDIPLTIAEK
jgi:phage-related minor tail protein